MSAARDDVVAYAHTLDGLSAAPVDPDRRAAYLEVIAPNESKERCDQMATMSGCELVQRGILRRFIRHPRLEARYINGRAGADLLEIARQANGAFPWQRKTPEPGDILIIGGGTDGGGPEHAYMVLTIRPDPDDDDALLAHGLDGGQRDDEGFQIITTREHVLRRGLDQASDGNDPGGGTARKVRFILDLEAILQRFGRTDEDAHEYAHELAHEDT
ncbi:Hypothetical protein A7982_00772 [Minicystis rosea]|nr:Hypothetical protein A7982_00772 [Minicystis rosea]